MAHHKRKGPKSTRAGCLLCKPYKRQGAKQPPASAKRRILAAQHAEKEAAVQRNLRLTKAGDIS